MGFWCYVIHKIFKTFKLLNVYGKISILLLDVLSVLIENYSIN